LRHFLAHFETVKMGKARSTPKNLNRRPTVEKKPTRTLEVVKSVLKGCGRAVTEPEKTPFKSPMGRMELSTPERDKAVQVINMYRSPRSKRIKRGSWDNIVDELKVYGGSIAYYKSIASDWMTQYKRGVPIPDISLSRERAGRCGRHTSLTPEMAKTIIEANAVTKGALSQRKLVKHLAEKGAIVERSTLRRWLRAMDARRFRRYIKPKLEDRHKKSAIEYVLDRLEKGPDGLPKLFPVDPFLGERVYRFTDLTDEVHGDEKWFFLMKDGTAVRVFPNSDGTYTIPTPARVYHKSRMPKVMFLAVVGRPRPEYGFDGKIGIWSFTVERLAQRGNKRTGTVAGETVIIEDVKIDAAAYVKKITGKGGVFEMMRKKMSWFHQDSGKPEAGRPLYYQHDGARPHTAKANQEQYEHHGALHGFDIRIRQQVPQKPEFNFLDLAFFRSLDSDVTAFPKTTRKELIKAVEKCFEKYDANRMEACCRSLITAYRGNLETGGDNNYKSHRGVRKARLQGDFDLLVAKSVVDGAKGSLETLRKNMKKPATGLAAAFEDSSESSDSD
jgi:hypothetical protein